MTETPIPSLRRFVRPLTIAVIAGVVGYFLAMLLPKTYASGASLYFPSSGAKPPSSFQALTGASSLEGDPGSVSNLGGAYTSPLVGSGPQTATGILLSRTCLTEVVQKLGLTKRWDLSEFAAYDKLYGGVSVAQSKSGLLEIEVNLNDPKLCKDVIDHMVAHLLRRSEELTINLSKKVRKQVEQKYLESREEVIAKRERYERLLQGLPVTDGPEFAKALLAMKGRLDEAKVEYQAAARQLAVSKNQASKLLDPNKAYPGNLDALKADASGGAGGLDAKSIQTLAAELERRTIELNDAAKTFAPSSPEYRDLKKRLGAVEALAAKVISARQKDYQEGRRPELFRLESQIEVLKVTIDAYSKIVSDYERTGSEIPKASAAIMDGRSEFEAALKKRELLEAELSRAKIAEERDPSRFEVVDQAIVQSSPVAPRKGMIAVAFFLFALVAQFLPQLFRVDD